MKTVHIKKGADLALEGKACSGVIEEITSGEYALLIEDYPYLKPAVMVKEGQRIKAGEPLLADKNMESLTIMSPVSGTVKRVIRGEKRVLKAIVVDTEPESEWRAGNSFSRSEIDSLTPENITNILINAGLWTSLKSRPFGTVADPAKAPAAVFVTAIDTRPLAPAVNEVIRGREGDFETGIRVLSRLTEGKIYVCVAPDFPFNIPQDKNIEAVAFDGPHPAGLPGTHVHFLRPVCRNRHIWEVGYQDVMAIGKLFLTGIADFKRIIAVAGTGMKEPKLVKTRTGGNIYDIVKYNLKEGSNRLINGSPLYGNLVTQEFPWLSRYSLQISSLPEGPKSTLFSWLTFGLNFFSIKRIFVSHILKPKHYKFDTSMRGSPRSMVPVGSYEQIMPLDIIITPFLRYLDVEDYERAEQLGALELLEEDLSLATYVSPEKTDFEPLLRRTLDAIRRDI